jgi:hypothetical protein
MAPFIAKCNIEHFRLNDLSHRETHRHLGSLKPPTAVARCPDFYQLPIVANLLPVGCQKAANAMPVGCQSAARTLPVCCHSAASRLPNVARNRRRLQVETSNKVLN